MVILVADGVRPDTLAEAMDGGRVPALARLRAEGGLHTLTSVFPSVTGPAYAPFVMGRYPGDVGLPALRWFDRARTTARWPHRTRSYVGIEGLDLDADLTPGIPTAYELVPGSVGALNVIGRGLAPRDRIGRSPGFVLRSGRTHLRGDARAWLDIDRDVGTALAQRIRSRQPSFVFAALTGIDKSSHSEGHEAPMVHEALGIVDDVAARLRADAEDAGTWDATHLWVVSDHGHSAVTRHDDLATAVRAAGHRVLAHPWVYGFRRADVAVMVSGNAMAHLYVELDARERPWWPGLAERWSPLAEQLLARPSVDLLLLPHGPDACEVRALGRGRAMVVRETVDGMTRHSYRPLDGDPLALGGTLDRLGADAAHAVTLDTDYPDALVQIASLCGAARSGELILSAARQWDFRSRYEPIPHVSSHGALHREHMLVPLLVNRPVRATPRRTVDVFASALAVLGVAAPAGIEGRSFV